MGKPWAMLWRLGAVVSLCVALAACTPGEYKGRVIAGLDDDGVLVVMLGVCEDDVEVEMSVYLLGQTATGVPVWEPVTARHEHGTRGMRAELRADGVPQGWSSDRWALPDRGTIEVNVVARASTTGKEDQYLDAAQVDLSAVPPLPGDATEQATEDC
jgi:hypothetical protein